MEGLGSAGGVGGFGRDDDAFLVLCWDFEVPECLLGLSLVGRVGQRGLGGESAGSGWGSGGATGGTLAMRGAGGQQKDQRADPAHCGLLEGFYNLDDQLLLTIRALPDYFAFFRGAGCGRYAFAGDSVYAHLSMIRTLVEGGKMPGLLM